MTHPDGIKLARTDEPIPASGTADELRRSWALTEADLRWVLGHQTLPTDVVETASEYLDHNELGLAWDVINSELPAPSPAVHERMEAARRRMESKP